MVRVAFLGTDPTIGRKIKGLGGFWGGMGSDSVNLPLPILYRKWHTVGVTYMIFRANIPIPLMELEIEIQQFW